MIDTLKKIFNAGPSIDLGTLIEEGASIIDVRTKSEYQSGHLKHSLNIPLDQLASKLASLDKSRPIITCCASGMRSGSAKSILKTNGFTEVYNGGSWTNLKALVK